MTDTYDLVIVGSGAGGLSTAVTAAYLGLRVIVLEKYSQIGGATAWSGGWMWIPRNPLAIQAGIVEDIAEPRAYLEDELGAAFSAPRIDAFLEQGPRMIAFMLERGLAFVDGNAIPDFHQTPHSALGGRSVCAAPFDARALGADLHRLRDPLDQISPFGMGIASGFDMRNFLSATRKLDSFIYAAKRLANHFQQRAVHGRGAWLVGGNSLVAQLYKAARELGVTILTSAEVKAPLLQDNRVVGVRLADSRQFLAHRGVVLAAGGFPHDQARKAQLFPHAPTGAEHFSAAPDESNGEGLRIGEAAGGVVGKQLPNAGAWAPVSLNRRRDGALARFPHLVERAKPGLIMVTRRGERFANEADSYHDLMQALFKAIPQGEPVEAWLVCDHTFLRRYGLGRARPRPFPLRPWLNNGYLKRGRTFRALAAACGIDAARFEMTVASFNRGAREGRDELFHRGESPYNRIQGEPEQSPNPCVAPILRAPFYAVKIVPGSLGTFAGLRTDAQARALDKSGSPIDGLYVVGNDAESLMGGHYPAGGITLGPAMTFGYIAAHAAAGVHLDMPRPALTTRGNCDAL